MNILNLEYIEQITKSRTTKKNDLLETLYDLSNERCYYCISYSRGLNNSGYCKRLEAQLSRGFRCDLFERKVNTSGREKS